MSRSNPWGWVGLIIILADVAVFGFIIWVIYTLTQSMQLSF